MRDRLPAPPSLTHTRTHKQKKKKKCKAATHLGRQLEQLGQAVEGDAGVVLGQDTNVVLNDPLLQVSVAPLALLSVGAENLCLVQLRAKRAVDPIPRHDLIEGKRKKEEE